MSKVMKHRYAVNATYRGSQVYLSMLSDRFRKGELGYQQSFRKERDGSYVLKLWFFKTEEYRKFDHFVKLVNMGVQHNPVVDVVAEVRENFYVKNVLNKGKVTA